MIVTTVFFVIPHKFRWFHLLIASCYFYAAFVPIYILILLGTIIIDYFAGIYIERTEGRKKKQLLILSIVANVGILFFFKYFNFFIDNINSTASFFGTSISLPLLTIILPIGLSFHTFQAMSYTIEVYRGNQKAEKHFGIYALYVLFYPQLVAGPIERPQNVLHQFHEKHKFSAENLWIGLRLMLWGLFKKVVIADRLSIFVDRVYDNPSVYHPAVLVLGTVFFAIQIYCDFSGYSDMAIGAAKTMGFNLMTNFNRPYFATNIKHFWDRWHISLSSWFRDYVYIPLGGNRVAESKLYFNVAIVFILSGFWHGANWTFIVWGVLHTVYLLFFMIVSRNNGASKSGSSSLFYKFSAWFLTFVFVCFAWIFFRATDLSSALGYIRSIVENFNLPFDFRIPPSGTKLGFGMFSYLISIVAVSILFIFEYIVSPRFEERLSIKKDVILCGSLVVFIIFFGVFQKSTFIYFQF
jgi:D-alanyl-lipoteichoic acid acyltransferase DltB (MBOAT superfamily)